MAFVRTIRELVFDMMFEDMSVMEMLSYYNDAAANYGLHKVRFNLYKNIKGDIDEDLYCKEDPLIINENGKTKSLTNLRFVSEYFPKALCYIVKDFNFYEDTDEAILEELLKRIIAKSKKLREYDIETLIAFVLDSDRDISLKGFMTTDMLLAKLIECDEEGEIEQFESEL